MGVIRMRFYLVWLQLVPLKIWGCSIITSRIGSGRVFSVFVMLRDGKQGGEQYFMKDRNVKGFAHEKNYPV